jgi:phosphonopyruvate decarboxylase
VEHDLYLGIPCSDFGYISEIPCTREDEAIAIAVGAWFVGKTPLVFMQNSGLGHCIDVITSLLKPYDIKIDLHIANRQEPEQHAFMGKITKDLLKLLEYETHKCD